MYAENMPKVERLPLEFSYKMAAEMMQRFPKTLRVDALGNPLPKATKPSKPKPPKFNSKQERLEYNRRMKQEEKLEEERRVQEKQEEETRQRNLRAAVKDYKRFRKNLIGQVLTNELSEEETRLKNTIMELNNGVMPTDKEMKRSGLNAKGSVELRSRLNIFLKRYKNQALQELRSRDEDDRQVVDSFTESLKDSVEYRKLFSDNSNKLLEGQTNLKKRKRYIESLFPEPKAAEKDLDDEKYKVIIEKEAKRQFTRQETAMMNRMEQATHIHRGLNVGRPGETWKVRYTHRPADGGPPQKTDEEVEFVWIEENFLPKFIALVRDINSKDKKAWVEIPLGHTERQTSRRPESDSAVNTDTLEEVGQSFVPQVHIQQVPIHFQQGDDRYCLAYGVASAVHYLGEQEAAHRIALCAERLANLPRTQAIQEIVDCMHTNLPHLGRHRILCDNLSNKKKRKRRRKQRQLTWKALLGMVDPYPKLIVPVSSDGGVGHAFVIVDDLLFDATQHYAMRLSKKSMHRIISDIHHIGWACTFDQNARQLGSYSREVVRHF